jgi:hypothetical protein
LFARFVQAALERREVRTRAGQTAREPQPTTDVGEAHASSLN